MKVYYNIISGGINDLTLQLAEFSSVCYFFDLQPCLSHFNSRRYQLETEIFLSHDTEFVEKELFGDRVKGAAPEELITCAQFIELLDSSKDFAGCGPVSVVGDKFWELLAPYANALKRSHPGRWVEARARSLQFVQDLLRKGRIYERYSANLAKKNAAPSGKTIVTAHCRLGDVALARRSDFEQTPLFDYFKSDFFLNKNLSEDEVGILLAQANSSAVWKRVKERPQLNRFSEVLEDLRRRAATAPLHAVFCTDGYSHFAQRFKRINGVPLSHDEIESIVNSVYLDSTLVSYDSTLVGESLQLLSATIDVALQADIMILSNSGFPLGLRRLLGIPDPEIIDLRKKRADDCRRV